jgi:hypothetical protein
MKLFRRLSAVTLLLCAHASAMAAATDWIPATTIMQVSNGWTGEQFVVILASGVSTCPGGANEYTISTDHKAYKDMVAMALTAFATGATVLIRPDGTCLGNNRAAILELRLVR